MFKTIQYIISNAGMYLLVGIFWSSIPLISSGQPIIADHTFVDAYSEIPQQYIDSVKKKWLSYAGESHSEAIRYGMELLETEDAKFAVNITEYSTPEGSTDSYLRVSRATWGDVDNSSGWIYSCGEEDWFTSSAAIARTKAGISYCNENGYQLDYYAFGWCYDGSYPDVGGGYDPVYHTRWGGESVGGPDGETGWGLDAGDSVLTGNRVNMSTYINATIGYIDYCSDNAYPTKVLFTTGPVDDDFLPGLNEDEVGYQQSIKWQYLRDFISTTNYTLFDYADILSHNDAGELSTTSWIDNNGDLQVYPIIHPDNIGGEYIAHIGSVGALRLAKAMWVLLAIEEGWDGGPVTIDNTAPSTPADLSAVAVSPTQINLSWSAATDNVGVTGYRIYRDGSFLTSTSSLNYSNTGLTQNTEYRYQVSAVDAAGNESALSASVYETTPVSPDTEDPTTPAGLSAVAVSPTQINLSWSAATDNVGVTGYRIYRDGSFLTSTSSLNYSNTGLTQNTEYRYQVSAVDAAGNESALSASVYETTPISPDTEDPSTPAGLSAEAVSPTQINLSWSAATDNVGVTGYRIYRDGSFLTSTSSLNYSNTGLTQNTEYRYQVSAVDAAGNESALSASVYETTPVSPDTEDPSTPAGLSAEAVSPTQINLSWSAATDNVGVTGYRIYRDGSLLVSTASTNYSNTGLTQNTEYQYQVSAVDAAGNESALSASMYETTPVSPDTEDPTTPAGLSAEAVSPTQINLSWSAATDNTGVIAYRIYCDGNFIAATTMLNYSHTGLTQNTEYQYRVSAIDAAVNESVLSEPVYETTQTSTDDEAPSAPTGLSAEVVSHSQINLSWNAATDNTGVTGYRIYRDGSSANTCNTPNYSDTGMVAGVTYIYSVTAFDFAGNESDHTSDISVYLNFSKVDGDINDEQAIKFYPNPLSNYLIIELPEPDEIVSIKIYSLTGTLVYHQKLYPNNFKIIINNLNLTNELYILQITQNNFTVNTKLLYLK